MNKEELIRMLEAVPDSYEDFVNCTAQWMLRDEGIQNAILEKMKAEPNATTSDILEVLFFDCLKLEPLEIVDDEEECSEDVQAAAPAFATVG